MLSYILAVVVLALVLVGNTLGPEATHISMRYFDSILHILAGFGLGFFFSALTASVGTRRFNTLIYVSIIVLCGGIAWEIFEAYYGLTGYALWSQMYYLDTFKDLLLDVVGAALAAHMVIKR